MKQVLRNEKVWLYSEFWRMLWATCSGDWSNYTEPQERAPKVTGYVIKTMKDKKGKEKKGKLDQARQPLAFNNSWSPALDASCLITFIATSTSGRPLGCHTPFRKKEATRKSITISNWVRVQSSRFTLMTSGLTKTEIAVLCTASSDWAGWQFELRYDVFAQAPLRTCFSKSLLPMNDFFQVQIFRLFNDRKRRRRSTSMIRTTKAAKKWLIWQFTMLMMPASYHASVLLVVVTDQ